jgi:ATP-dependent DNA helicase RecG
MLLVNHPERFGLAQLHQLRGRIGRGGSGGTCILLEEGGSGRAEERLSVFASTEDGFKLAEIDLKIRGPGEVWGTRQSGYPVFKLINPLGDSALVQSSWEQSGRLIEEDPRIELPENMVVARYYRDYYKSRFEPAEIG